MQKFPVDNLDQINGWSKNKLIKDTFQCNKNFIKIYNEKNDEGYFLEVDVQYPEKFHDCHNNLLFLPEKLKIEKLVANLHDKTECVIHIRNLKQTLNHGLVLKKVQRIIKFL